MRSRTGCLTCRQRKLKCDEVKPLCGQCRKATRVCRPSTGVVFRHQQNASMNGNDPGSAFYAYKNTFGPESVWLDIPKEVTFINTTNPYEDPSISDAYEPRLAASPPPLAHGDAWSAGHVPSNSGSKIGNQSGLEALSVVASANPYSFVGLEVATDQPVLQPPPECTPAQRPAKRSIKSAVPSLSPSISPRAFGNEDREIFRFSSNIDPNLETFSSQAPMSAPFIFQKEG